MAKSSSKNKKSALVIVESPAKARTISKYLGPGFVVESSVGHIRDLPSRAAEIPAELKSERWSRLGVNVEEGFRPIYIIPSSKKAQVRKLKGQLKKAATVYLATDEDREGEAIAWHLTEVLQPKVPVRRMVFDEITKSAISNAVDSTRDIDFRLVNAQETRRILDRLFGYEVSPVLWRKVKPKLSAGRVQSVATRLVVDRERARMRFVRAEYWDIAARLRDRAKEPKEIDCKLVEVRGKRVATGKDFVDETGELKGDAKVVCLTGEEARALSADLAKAEFAVSDVSEKPFTNRPYAPFITSTLQQEASRKLRFGAQRTMRVAQNLYENGYITYMRTDSTTLSSQAVEAARRQATELYGADYVPPHPRVYKSKSKSAQEAHEAIRPAGERFRTPESVAAELAPDELKLYDLIWKRTVASQMKDAEGFRTSVRIAAPGGERGEAVFSASGKVITFPGFLRAYVEGSEAGNGGKEDQEKVLPPLKTGQKLDLVHLEPLEHFTQPPARYTEASLIKELEQRGIGRPSTYANIIQTIQDRGYVWRKGTALVPTFTAFAVINLLEKHLPDLVDYEFTARMEDGLDEIAQGERESEPWLHGFYFGEPGSKRNGDHVADIGLRALVDASGEEIDARAVSCIPIGKTEDGREVVVRVGRYGPYVELGNGDRRVNVPDDIPPDELTPDKIKELADQAAKGDRLLGPHPGSGKPIYLKTGRYGPYVQLGDPELTEKGAVKRGGKPKMASVWPSMSVESLSLEDAVKLLSFPREVGVHPETGEPITAQDGRFGPYLKMGDDSRSLPNHEAMANITLEEAVEVFKQPKGRRRVAQPQVLNELGKHPASKAPIQVKSGRYGPYVTDGVVNATIPKGRDPSSIKLEDAVVLLEAREQKLRDQGKDPRAPKSKQAKAKQPKTKKAKAKKTTRKTAKAKK